MKFAFLCLVAALTLWPFYLWHLCFGKDDKSDDVFP